jgi:hypothetical protein
LSHFTTLRHRIVRNLIWPEHETLKLQKQKTREFHGKEYFRYAVVIPQAEIEKLGWKDNQELEPKSIGQKLIIEPSK